MGEIWYAVGGLAPFQVSRPTVMWIILFLRGKTFTHREWSQTYLLLSEVILTPRDSILSLKMQDLFKRPRDYCNNYANYVVSQLYS